jgi:hypothetical protein
MKTSLIVLALLIGAAAAPVNAQEQAASGNQPRAAASAEPAPPAPVDKAPAQEPGPPIDISNLVPKDSAQPDRNDHPASSHRFDSRGVDCSLYPARCD